MYFRINNPLTADEIRRLRMLQEKFGKLFETDDKGKENEDNSFEPALNMYEADNAYIYVLEMTGLDREKIKLTMEDKYFVIFGEPVSFYIPENVRTIHQEIRPIRYERNIQIPDNVSVDGIHAEFRNGLLYIFAPKKAVKEKKQVEITIE